MINLLQFSKKILPHFQIYFFVPNNIGMYYFNKSTT